MAARAGDLAPFHLGVLRAMAQAWRSAAHIFYMPGNHEIDAVRTALARTCADLGIELPGRRSVAANGVRFIGATLWTDFALDGVPETIPAKTAARRRMADFAGSIRHRERLFTPAESARRHAKDRAFVEAELEAAAEMGQTPVAVTHRAPTPRSVRPWRQGDPLNPAFASDLEGVIGRHGPRLWIHGHRHDSVDERLGPARVIANPGGCAPTENPRFDPALCVDAGP